MIIQLFYLIINAVLGILNNYLPDAGTLSSSVFSWVSYFHAGAQFVGIFLPMSQFYIILGLFIAIETSLLIFKLGIFVYNLIRGSGASIG